jgi:hypothetical protein
VPAFAALAPAPHGCDRPSEGPDGQPLGPGLAWANATGDGRPELLVTCADSGRLLSGGDFADLAPAAGVPMSGRGAAWADVDRDVCLDVFIAGLPGRLLRGDCHGTFSDVTASLGLAGVDGTAAGWADVDRDGHIDLFVAGAADGTPAADRLYLNQGAAFVEATGAGLAGRTAGGFAWLQLSSDDFPDLVTAGGAGAAMAVYHNLGDRTLRDETQATGLGQAAAATSVGSGDFDRDTLPDLVLAGPSGTALWRSRGDGTFEDATRDAGLGAQASRAVAVADFNDDGWDDLMVGGPAGVHLLLNAGGRFVDTAAPGLGGPPVLTLAVADWDRDGWLDVAAAVRDGSLVLYHGLGTPAPADSTWLEVRLVGNESTTDGLGARLVATENGFPVARQVGVGGAPLSGSDAVVHFGLGRVAGQIDQLQVLWPSGIRQGVTQIDRNVTITVKEDASSKTSCPLLFVRDADGRIRFVSDVAGEAYTGWLVAPGVHHLPDPTELVRLDGLGEVDGGYELRLLEALEETDYVDHVQLVAVDHPPGLDVVPDDAFQVAPPYRDFGLVPLVAPRHIASAADGEGRDVTWLVSSRDRLYPSVPALPRPTFDGYAQPHTLTLDLGDVAGAPRLHLAAWAWVYYPMVTPRLAAEGPYLAPQPPSMEALDPATGEWKKVTDDAGFPMGLPKWWTLDLTGKLPAGAHVVRLTTNLRVYWDEILVDTGPAPPASMLRVQALAPDAADLHAAGYPAFASPDGHQPPVYDYARRSPTFIWKPQAGHYTRFGDVADLLLARDDRFATFGPGEEVTMRFSADRFGPVPAGMQRTFFAWFDLFTKDTEPYNAFPETVEPLPFHSMTNYPYGPTEHYPDDAAHRAYLATYQTRLVL